jgi:cytochrome c oxidase subunit 2
VILAKGPSVLDPVGPGARHIAGIWWTMFALAVVVYVVVGGLILWASVRGRRSADDAGGRPSSISDNAFIWVGGIAVPVVILALLAVMTVRSATALSQPSGHALRISVSGRQWWWQVVYPKEAIVTANELHVPVGRPVEVELRTDDVIHSFWVPQLNGKLDLVPDQVNHLRFRADRAGTYRGACAEYCGAQHANMNFLVIAMAPRDYDRWVTRRRQPPPSPSDELTAAGQAALMRESCAGCHAIRGTQAVGSLGPDLSDVGARRSLGAGVIPNRLAYLREWIVNAPHFKPKVLMPPVDLSAADAAAIAAYLDSLK